MVAVIRLDFDPVVHVLGTALRLETVGVAAAMLVALLLAALAAGRMPATRPGQRHLRRDDLFLLVFGALPGAIVGGRLDYVLIHADYYRANPGAILDTAQGGSALTLAVVFGAATALAVGRLLEAPVGRWLHVVSVPLLVGLGLGKLAMALGGAGQGGYSTWRWATEYVHAGAWATANPAIPALPSQVIEGLLVLAAALALLVVPGLLRIRLRGWGRIVRPGRSPRRDWSALRDARRFLVALLLWAAIRFGVAFTWRDARVLGPLGAEQLLLLGIILLDGATLVRVSLRDHSRAAKPAAITATAPATDPPVEPLKARPR